MKIKINIVDEISFRITYKTIPHHFPPTKYLIGDQFNQLSVMIVLIYQMLLTIKYTNFSELILSKQVLKQFGIY